MIQYVGAHSVSLWSNSRGSKDSTYTWFNVTNKCLSVCSVRNTPPVCITDTSVLITSVLSPPQGCSESFPGCHFPKCLRLRSSSALVSQTWCNLPDSNPQWSPTFLVPVPWTCSVTLIVWSFFLSGPILIDPRTSIGPRTGAWVPQL